MYFDTLMKHKCMIWQPQQINILNVSWEESRVATNLF